MLNKADAVKEWVINKGKNIFGAAVSFVKNIGRVFKSTQEETDWYGMQQVREFLDACGWSGGFSMGASLGNLISNVINAVRGFFGGSSKDKDYCIRCGACGEEIRCVVRRGQKCPKCPAIREC